MHFSPWLSSLSPLLYKNPNFGLLVVCYRYTYSTNQKESTWTRTAVASRALPPYSPDLGSHSPLLPISTIFISPPLEEHTSHRQIRPLQKDDTNLFFLILCTYVFKYKRILLLLTDISYSQTVLNTAYTINTNLF